MKGLERIEDKILAEAHARVAEIAKETAEAVAAADREADAAIARVRAASEATLATERAALDRRSASATSLESRRILLSARRDLVSEVLAQAAVRLAALPADRKAALYADLLERNGRAGGTVRFSAADLASGVADLALQSAAKRSTLAGVAFRKDDAPHAASGGIVLVQGDVSSNLTFEMLFKQSQEDLESLAAAMLSV
jgi:vacuolar-type H+-ATPase subunit E/Vma4